ncbi:MAG: hypothetical protein IT406_01290 [Candidatus Yanofskybacteria bacterium]|nr:hypothetical protein [Candidatus Yanofskybacteria bacterium]
MFVLRVIPLASLPATAPGVLDYFWSAPLPIGSVVRISWGRRQSPAVVTNCIDVRRAKLAVKKSSFALKPIDAVLIDTPQATESQIALAQWLATYYAASPATSLKTVLPPFFGKPKHRVTLPESPKLGAAVPTGTFVLTQPDTAIAELRTVIARSDGPVLIIAPERSTVEHLAHHLADTGPTVFHSGLSTTAHAALYRAVIAREARVVIGTRGALFLPWTALSHLVIEDPLSEIYKSESAPRYNTPDVARQLAAHHCARLTWISPAISTVHFHLKENGALRVVDHKPHWPTVETVSMEHERRDGNRLLLSRKAQDAILDAYEDRSPLLVLSARKAYATALRCARCHSSPRCANCRIPLRLHRTVEDMLVCYHCGAFHQVPKQCPSCASGPLKPAGTPGSQKLAEAIRTLLDRYGHSAGKLPILDGDLVRNERDERAVLDAFNAMGRPMLVASSMIFGHRYQRTFSTVIIPHIDALAANPDFRTNERLVAQLERIADLRPSRIIIQQWHDDELLDVTGRAWDKLYRDELAQRKMLRWPPYTRLVKLSVRHRDRRAVGRLATVGADRLRRAIDHMGATARSGTSILGPSNALIEHARGEWTQQIILKTSLTGERLPELLAYLPPGWLVDVDPRSIA